MNASPATPAEANPHVAVAKTSSPYNIFGYIYNSVKDVASGVVKLVSSVGSESAITKV